MVEHLADEAPALVLARQVSRRGEAGYDLRAKGSGHFPGSEGPVEEIEEEDFQMIQPIIVRVPRQAHEVNRLVEFCRQLDGTEVLVLDCPKAIVNLPYPHGNNASFHFAANEMKGRPFCWLEPDSIPLQVGWLAKLEEVYVEMGKEILISTGGTHRDDLVGGIGIYGPNAHWLFPKRIESGAGFDGWMLRHLSPLIARTPAIQHSYGDYGSLGVKDWRFPKNKSIIDPQAVIFHRDKHQDLIGWRPTPIHPVTTGNVFHHTGDLGDIIAALPTIRQLGGGKLLISNEATGFIRPMENRFGFIRSLLEAQPYIQGVEWGPARHGTRSFDAFRSNLRPGMSLAHAQAKLMGIHGDELDLSPWLVVPEAPRRADVVMARSPRYHNPAFPWRELAKSFEGRAGFVGLAEEHKAFQQVSGSTLPRLEIDNALGLAQAIQGAALFVGNQSFPWWVAAGLGIPFIQETYAPQPDSTINRPHGIYIK